MTENQYAESGLAFRKLIFPTARYACIAQAYFKREFTRSLQSSERAVDLNRPQKVGFLYLARSFTLPIVPRERFPNLLFVASSFFRLQIFHNKQREKSRSALQSVASNFRFAALRDRNNSVCDREVMGSDTSAYAHRSISDQSAVSYRSTCHRPRARFRDLMNE